MLLGSILLAATAAPAGAATVVRSTVGEGLRIDIGLEAGDDRFEVFGINSSAGDFLLVRDIDGDQVLPAENCNPDGSSAVRCAIVGPPIITTDLRGGNDSLSVLDQVGDCFCVGGSGNDTITNIGDNADLIDGGTGNDTIQSRGGGDRINGQAGNDTLDADAGNDVVSGGAGDDTVTGGLGDDEILGGDGNDFTSAGDSADGADTISLGPGTSDVISYASRGFPVSLSVDGQRNDGAKSGRTTPPEGDFIAGHTGKVTLRGGFGSDDLVGGAGPERLEGRGGNDVLRGGNGRAGVDDTLEGGAGADDADGQGGDDELLMRDAEDDQASAPFACGLGNDKLVADLRDDDTRGLFGRGCEIVDQGELREDPNVIVRSRRAVLRDGMTSVRLTCPRKTRRGCKGSLAAGREGARPSFGPATRYSLRRGRSATVRVALRHRERFVLLRSVERGHRGRARTTLRTLPLRR
jgi:Ca2+-binding RTX toxin-like protein